MSDGDVEGILVECRRHLDQDTRDLLKDFLLNLGLDESKRVHFNRETMTELKTEIEMRHMVSIQIDIF